MKKVINEQLRTKNEFTSDNNIYLDWNPVCFRLNNTFIFESEKEMKFPRAKKTATTLKMLKNKYLKKLQKINEAYYSYWQALFLEFENEVNKTFENDKQWQKYENNE